MALKKEYSKNRPVCNVTFTLPEKIARSAEKVSLVCDFNQWNPVDTPMKKAKNGSFSVSISLPTRKEYQFRYLLDGTHWENDNEADKYIPMHLGDTENSVVIV